MSYKKFNLVTITPTLSTSEVGTGKILFNPTKVPNACPRNGASIIRSIHVLDLQHEENHLHLIFMKKGTSLGTPTLNPSISDPDARAAGVLGIIQCSNTAINFGDGSSFTQILDTGLVVESDGDDNDEGAIYVAGLGGATQTYSSADSLVISIGFEVF